MTQRLCLVLVFCSCVFVTCEEDREEKRANVDRTIVPLFSFLYHCELNILHISREKKDMSRQRRETQWRVFLFRQVSFLFIST